MHVLKKFLAGEIMPVIDKIFPLSELADALRYLQEGHACGKIIIVPQ